MTTETTGRFRVLADPDDEDRWLFVRTDAEDPDQQYAPTYLAKSGHGDVDRAVADLRPGYLVEATIDWSGEAPQIADLAVRKRTLFEFVPRATNLFDAARATWQAAVADGEAMNSQVTYDTDGSPNGVLYVFAEQSGPRDLFEEFRSGVRPLEPLVERVNDRHDPEDQSANDNAPEVGIGPEGIRIDPGEPTDDSGQDPDHGLGADREVFVMDPADDPFVLVYIVLRKGGLLADTMRDTYHCPRPDGE